LAENLTAARVKAARRRHAWTREELAVRSGLSWSAIAQIESGRRTNLRPATLAALADALGVTADYLLGLEPSTQRLCEHQVLIYSDDASFMATVAPFVRAGMTLDEPVLVVTTSRNLALLREDFRSDPAKVTFAEADGIYRTPMHALTHYRRFITEAIQGGAAWARVVGEPVWSGRTEAELQAWMRYESLVNLALSHLPSTVICAYDAAALDSEILDHARVAHPCTREGEAVSPSSEYTDPDEFLLRT
jgi:transcriptional regulator with XRE-family HTH domain